MSRARGPSNIWRGRCVFPLFLTVSRSVKQTVEISQLLPAMLPYDLQKLREQIWYFSTRTKLLLCEQRGLHSPLFSNPCRAFLQMSQQRRECGLRGEK